MIVWNERMEWNCKSNGTLCKEITRQRRKQDRKRENNCVRKKKVEYDTRNLTEKEKSIV